MITVDTARCISCGACARACPMGIFRMTDEGLQVREGKNCLGCYHCAAACPQEAVSFEGLTREELYRRPTGDPVIDHIRSRRSVRHFEDRPPAREVLQAAMDLSEYAPSGKNEHLNGWSVLYGREQVERARQMVLEWARTEKVHPELIFLDRRGKDPVTCGAPCVLVVYSAKGCSNPVVDPAIAAALAEQSLTRSGLGTCWGGYLGRAIKAYPPLWEYLEIPAGSEVAGVLLTGYPKGENYVSVPHRPPARVTWIE